MDIKKIVIKYPSFIKLCFKMYGIWSNIYQKFEKDYFYNKNLLRKHDEKTDISSWSNYCGELELTHYGSDKWYMGFDVISTPSRFVTRKVGDCDDFALLAYDYFGNNIYYGCKYYIFEGLYTIINSNGEGHVVAVWKAPIVGFQTLCDYIVVSNNEIYTSKTECLKKDLNFNKKYKILYVGRFVIKRNKLKFSGFIEL